MLPSDMGIDYYSCGNPMNQPVKMGWDRLVLFRSAQVFRFGFGVADVNPSDIADVRWLCPCQCSLHGRIPGGHNFYASAKGHVAMLTELRWEFFLLDFGITKGQESYGRNN